MASMGADAMNNCFDYNVVKGDQVGERNFDYLTDEQDHEIQSLGNDRYVFEKVGTILLGPHHWLGFLMGSYGPNYARDYTDISGPVHGYFRHSSYPKDHWHFYIISNNPVDPVHGSQTYTINTWHMARKEHWYLQGYYVNGICDKFRDWHCVYPEGVPAPMPSAPVLSAQALQGAPQQMSMDNEVQDEDDGDADSSSRWCRWWPMRRAEVEITNSGGEPLIDGSTA